MPKQHDMKNEFPNFTRDELYQRAAKLVQKLSDEWKKPLFGKIDESAASDLALAEELAVYAQNEREFYTKWATPIINNLRKHIKRGKFDKKLSWKSWERAANAAADMYAKEFGGKGAKGKDMFPPSVRKLAAKIFAEDYEEEIFDGVEQ